MAIAPILLSAALAAAVVKAVGKPARGGSRTRVPRPPEPPKNRFEVGPGGISVVSLFQHPGAQIVLNTAWAYAPGRGGIKKVLVHKAGEDGMSELDVGSDGTFSWSNPEVGSLMSFAPPSRALMFQATVPTSIDIYVLSHNELMTNSDRRYSITVMRGRE